MTEHLQESLQSGTCQSWRDKHPSSSQCQWCCVWHIKTTDENCLDERTCGACCIYCLQCSTLSFFVHAKRPRPWLCTPRESVPVLLTQVTMWISVLVSKHVPGLSRATSSFLPRRSTVSPLALLRRWHVMLLSAVKDTHLLPQQRPHQGIVCAVKETLCLPTLNKTFPNSALIAFSAYLNWGSTVTDSMIYVFL